MLRVIIIMEKTWNSGEHSPEQPARIIPGARLTQDFIKEHGSTAASRGQVKEAGRLSGPVGP